MTVAMITVKDMSITTTDSQNQNDHKRRNECFQFFILSKFYPIFLIYVRQMCQDWVASGKQILEELEQICKNKDLEYWQEQHKLPTHCCLQDPEEVEEWLFKPLLAVQYHHKSSLCRGAAYQLEATRTMGLGQSGGRLYSHFPPIPSTSP